LGLKKNLLLSKKIKFEPGIDTVAPARFYRLQKLFAKGGSYDYG